MSADSFTGAVAYANVEMRAIDRNGSRETYNFKMAGSFTAIGLISEADIIVCQAADTRTDPACFNLLFVNQLLDLFLRYWPGLRRNACVLMFCIAGFC